MRAFQSGLIAVALALPGLAGCGKGGVDVASARTSTVSYEPSAELRALTRRALDDFSLAQEVREEGPPGLQALFAEANAQRRLDASLDPLLDRVAGQRYARHSGLYWYTDLDAAVVRAEAENKPILSLRLLGDLRDDLSCANSRYFRVVLYADPSVRADLRSFVLHWSSERPVPKITVDYGDGRKLVRTITGNSIHYVLDSHGRVVDAIPGLMAARAFRQELGEARMFAEDVAARSDDDFGKALRVRHAEREIELLDRWKNEFAAVGVTIENRDPKALAAQSARFDADLASMPELPPPADYAEERAATKAVPETTLLRAVTPKPAFSESDARRESTLAVWSRVAERHASSATLSKESLELMRELAPRGFDIDGHAVPLDAEGFEALVGRFRKVLALDTIRNRLELRLEIHQRLAAHPLDSFADLNRWVYASVFLTPRTDPWLGLTADRGFTAIPSDGVARTPE